MPIYNCCFLKTWLLKERVGRHGEKKKWEKKKPKTLELSVTNWFSPCQVQHQCLFLAGKRHTNALETLALQEGLVHPAVFSVLGQTASHFGLETQ